MRFPFASVFFARRFGSCGRSAVVEPEAAGAGHL